MLRVAPYSRVSTDDDDQLNSLENQVQYWKGYIERCDDWILTDMYVDEGITGTNIDKRDDFNRLISDAMNGKIDLIITKEVSRFARNTVDTLSITRKLKTVGVGVIFINDNIDTRDNDGEFRLTIMASVAQEESRKTSMRVKWGMKRQMEKGYVFVGTIIGYDAKDGKLTINQEEAEIVKMIFYKFVEEGKGALTIAKELIAAQMPVPAHKRFKKWGATAITRILKNEKYVGDLLQKKTYTPDYLTHKSAKNNGQEEKVFIENHHEPIIDRKIWDKSQEEWKRRKSLIEDKSRYSNKHWCSGKIVCSICGATCVMRSKMLKSGMKYKAWRCKEVTTYGKPRPDGSGNIVGCTNKQLNEKALNACVHFATQQINLLKDEILQELKIDLLSVSKANNTQDVIKYENNIKTLMVKKEKIIDLLLDGDITKEEMNDMKRKYDADITNLRHKIEFIKNTNERIYKTNLNIKNMLSKIESILNQDNSTPEMYKQIIDKIIMYPINRLDIYFKHISIPIQVEYNIDGRGDKYKTTCKIIDMDTHIVTI